MDVENLTANYIYLPGYAIAPGSTIVISDSEYNVNDILASVINAAYLGGSVSVTSPPTSFPRGGTYELGGLPDTAGASVDDVLKLNSNLNAIWDQASASGSTDIQYETRSSNIILGTVDKGKAIDITAEITQTFEADETLGDGWFVYLRNATDDGETLVTLNPAGAETIDGLSAVTMYSGEVRLIICNGAGANFNSVLLSGGFARFIADGDFIVPHGITQATVECIGGGGGGGGGRGGNAGTSRNGGSGGGGGARNRLTFVASALGAPGDTIAIVVGAGGTSGAGGSGANGSNGGIGGSTTFGSTLVVAHGGGPGLGGAATGNNRGGGGGGGVGEAGQIGGDNVSSRGGTAAVAGGIGHGGEGGGDSVSGAGGASEYGGASGGHTFGAGAGDATTGGGSVWGGSGGGAGGDVSSGNGERIGGAGGASGVWQLAGVPGGGGAVDGGAGASGTPGDLRVCGSGGAGGGSQNSGTGGAGGDGGAPGGGAGGGAGGTTVGGAGGVGGIGECRVWYS